MVAKIVPPWATRDRASVPPSTRRRIDKSLPAATARLQPLGTQSPLVNKFAVLHDACFITHPGPDTGAVCYGWLVRADCVRFAVNSHAALCASVARQKTRIAAGEGYSLSSPIDSNGSRGCLTRVRPATRLSRSFCRTRLVSSPGFTVRVRSTPDTYALALKGTVQSPEAKNP